MISAVWFVVAASMGIDVGWQPVDEGGYEFLLQIEPEQLENLKAGEALTSDLPELPGRVVRVHWMVGTDPLPQTTLPSTVSPATTPPAQTPPAEAPLESTTTNRPIEPTGSGELSLTDGRTATNLGSASRGEHGKTADAAAEQPELPLALAVPPASESSSASTASDSWHSATPATKQEPASQVAATGFAPIDRVGPVDPGETDVDLSDSLDAAPASVAPRLDGQPEYVSVATPWTDSSPGTDAAVTASTGAAMEHRARPDTTATGEARAAAARHEESADTSGKSEAEEPPPSDDSSAPNAPRPLAWLAAMATLGASLAGNVFFFWGFVDAKRRYRTALRDSGLLPT